MGRCLRWRNWQRNYALWSEDPTAYNLVNLYTHGLVEMVDGALFSDEPLSFQYVMDIIGTATLLFGAAKVIQRSGSSRLSGAAASTIDDTLEDIARRNGKITQVISADDLNEAYLKRNPAHDAPFTPEIKVFRITYTGNVRFLRVFSDESYMSNSWIMNADDVAGLTASEIQDKFSIHCDSPPTHICDIAVPKGATLEISSANGTWAQWWWSAISGHQRL